MIFGHHTEFLASANLRQIGEASGEQITLAQARNQMNLDAYGSPPEHPDDDWLSEIGIPGARELCEGYLSRALAPSVYELSLWAFPGTFLAPFRFPIAWGAWQHTLRRQAIMLPMAPIAGVSSVSYVDGDGNAQTLDPSGYVIDARSEPGWIYPATGTSWPATNPVPNAVTVLYHAGYTLPTDSPNDLPIPRRYVVAMLLTLAHLYERREQTSEVNLMEIPMGAQAFMERGRLRLSMA